MTVSEDTIRLTKHEFMTWNDKLLCTNFSFKVLGTFLLNFGIFLEKHEIEMIKAKQHKT